MHQAAAVDGEAMSHRAEATRLATAVSQATCPHKLQQRTKKQAVGFHVGDAP